MNVAGLVCATLLNKTFDSGLLASSTIRKTSENRGYLTIQCLAVLDLSQISKYLPSDTLPKASRRTERLFHFRPRGAVLRCCHKDLIHSRRFLLRVDSRIKTSANF